MVSVKDKSNFDKKTYSSHGNSPRDMYGPGGLRTTQQERFHSNFSNFNEV